MTSDARRRPARRRHQIPRIFLTPQRPLPVLGWDLLKRLTDYAARLEDRPVNIEGIEVAILEEHVGIGEQ